MYKESRPDFRGKLVKDVFEQYLCKIERFCDDLFYASGGGIYGHYFGYKMSVSHGQSHMFVMKDGIRVDTYFMVNLRHEKIND